MHPAGRARHGHPVPGQVRDGQDRRLRASHPAADRAAGWAGVRARNVPHQGARLPDQQRVREVLQVHVRHQGNFESC